MPSQGDIILTPIPYTDLSSQKRRPAIVISNNVYNSAAQDVVLAAMTSNPLLDSYSFVITTADLVQGNLNHPGVVRADKLFTLSQTLILRTFGRVNDPTLARIRDLLRHLTAKRL